MRRRVQPHRAVVLLAALWLLAACAAPPPEPVLLRVGVLATESYLPYFVMREQGIARRVGIRLEGVKLAAGSPLVRAMAAGEADLGFVSSVAMLLAQEQGQVPNRVVAIAAGDFVDRAHPGAAIVVPFRVAAWRELEGAYIGIPGRTSILGVAAMARLRMEGVRQVHPIEIPFANMGLAIASGHVRAGVMLEPYLSQSLVRGDGKLLDWVLGGPPLEEVLFTQLAVRTELLRAQPETVKRLLRGYLQAVRWIRDYPADARAVLVKSLDIGPEVAEKIRMRRWEPDVRSDARLLGALQELLVREGMLKGGLPVGQLSDERLLEAVRGEAG